MAIVTYFDSTHTPIKTLTVPNVRTALKERKKLNNVWTISIKCEPLVDALYYRYDFVNKRMERWKRK